MKHDEKLTRYGALVCGLLLVCGCNSYNVQALPYDAGLKSVTVIANPKVAVHDFVDVMVDEFNARNIKVVSAPPNYVANRRNTSYGMMFGAHGIFQTTFRTRQCELQGTT